MVVRWWGLLDSTTLYHKALLDSYTTLYHDSTLPCMALLHSPKLVLVMLFTTHSVTEPHSQAENEASVTDCMLIQTLSQSCYTQSVAMVTREH